MFVELMVLSEHLPATVKFLIHEWLFVLLSNL